MPISSTISRTRDLDKPTTIESLPHVLAMGDQQGDQFNVAITRGSSPVDISTGACTGWFIRVEDGKKIEDCTTVSLTGTVSSNIATIILPEACYVTPCRFIFAMYVTLSGRRHAVYICEGVAARTSTNKLVDPGKNIPDLNELLAKLGEMETARQNAQNAANAANTAKTNADTATKKANDAATDANTAKTNADAAANLIKNMTVTTTKVAAGGNPTAALTKATNPARYNLALGLVTGNTGAAAGISSVTASVDDKVGTPSVEVTKGGTAAATTLDFKFHNLKGNTGDGDISTVWGARPDDTGDAKPEVGGRNLALDTEREITTPAFSTLAYGFPVRYNISDNAYRCLKDSISTTYTISVEAKKNVDNGAGERLVMFGSIRTGHYTTNAVIGVQPNFNAPLTTEFVRYYATGHLEKPEVIGDTNDLTLFLAVNGMAAGSNSITVRNVKVEFGSVPTDWSPAPEDLVTTFVGGRNYVIGFKPAEYPHNGTELLNSTYRFTIPKSAKVGDTILLSYHVSVKNLTASNVGIRVQAKASPSGINYENDDYCIAQRKTIGNVLLPVGDSEQDIRVIYALTEEHLSQDYWTARFIFSNYNNINADSTIKVTDFKVEKGAAPTFIGGRNLIPKSAAFQFKRTNTSKDYLSEVIPVFAVSDYGRSSFKAGDIYTLSFDYKINGITEPCQIFLALRETTTTYNLVIEPKFSVSAGDNSGHYVGHTTISQGAATDGDGGFLLRGFGIGQNGGTVIDLSNVKFERGNVETDWTPAPEDYHEDVRVYSSTTGGTYANFTPESIAGGNDVELFQYGVEETGRPWARTYRKEGADSSKDHLYSETFKPTAADVGALPLTGGTVNGAVKICKIGDASASETSSEILLIANSLSSSQLALDGNEIQAKANKSTAGPLYLNADGGVVNVGPDGLYSKGPVTAPIAGPTADEYDAALVELAALVAENVSKKGDDV